MTARHDFYRLVATPFGDLGMVWTENAKVFRMLRIFLPEGDGRMIDLVRDVFPMAGKGDSEKADQMGRRLQKAMEGKSGAFSLADLDLKQCTSFQRTILAACFRIPRGRVCSYGALAKVAGVPKGARAAGTVMATNPFPLVIPCHRVVRSDGALGGFGGGLAMKRALLAGEGVHFDNREMVVSGCMVENL